MNSKSRDQLNQIDDGRYSSSLFLGNSFSDGNGYRYDGYFDPKNHVAIIYGPLLNKMRLPPSDFIFLHNCYSDENARELIIDHLN